VIGPRTGIQRRWHCFGRLAVKLPIGSCTPLAISVGSHSNECLGQINMRSFLGSPLVVVGKGLELIRNCSVGHGLGSTEQSLCCFQVFLAAF
jgi:hypothetical protein